jgi:hypothetical protein
MMLAIVDGALFAFQRLQKSSVVENQRAADAECSVAHARAEQDLVQIGGGKVFGGGAGVNNLMHADLMNSAGKPDQRALTNSQFGAPVCGRFLAINFNMIDKQRKMASGRTVARAQTRPEVRREGLMPINVRPRAAS